jgi:2-(3-amino-3-carboxypropyl)histidine synthase
MEEDRLATDVGIAADIEEAELAQAPVQKQPKKRFVGRRTADASASASAKNGANSSIEDSGAIQGKCTGTVMDFV